MKTIIEADDGSLYEIDETWELDFGEDRPLDVLEIVELDEVDLSLCDHAEVCRSSDGRFFLVWSHRHPEIGTADEFFGPDHESRSSKKRLAEWEELMRRMPSDDYAREISRKDAYRLVTYFWLPAEFHREALLF